MGRLRAIVVLLALGLSGLVGCAAETNEGIDIELSGGDGKFDVIQHKRLRLSPLARDPLLDGVHGDVMDVLDVGDKVVVTAHQYELEFFFQDGRPLTVEGLPARIYQVSAESSCEAATDALDNDGDGETDEPGEGCAVDVGFVIVRNPLAPWSAEAQPLVECGGTNYFTSVLIDPEEGEITADGVTYGFADCGISAYPQGDSGWVGDYLGFGVFPVPLSAEGALGGVHGYELTVAVR